MIKPSEDVCKALLALQNNGNFEVVAKWVHDSWIQVSIKNNGATGEATIKNQGRGLELEEIIKHIESAYDYLESYKQARKIEANRIKVGGKI